MSRVHDECTCLQETFRLCQKHLDGVVLVDNASISAAIKDMFTETRTVLEPAGALALAGAKAYLARNDIKVHPSTSTHAYNVQPPWQLHPRISFQFRTALLPQTCLFTCFRGSRATLHVSAPLCVVPCARIRYSQGYDNPEVSLQGKNVVAVTSGANMNFDRLRLVADLANFGLRTEAMLVVSIPESPGEFLKFIDTALSSEDGSKITVSEFKYRYSVDRPAKILFSISTASPEAIESAVQRLGDAGYRCQNVTGSGAAQLHLRHMVGGRPRSYTGSIDHEKMVVVRTTTLLSLPVSVAPDGRCVAR